MEEGLVTVPGNLRLCWGRWFAEENGRDRETPRKRSKDSLHLEPKVHSDFSQVALCPYLASVLEQSLWDSGIYT